MAPKNFAEIDTGFPIYGLRFINNHTILTCGGGGEGNNGIPNKVTAIRCSFTVADKSRQLQRFREITLPSNEDSPMCVEFCASNAEGNSRYLIFVGCNQSTELIRSMNINNNLRKYNYTDDEHLQFVDAVQFDDSLLVGSIGEYPKIIHLSSDASVGGMMTSQIPSEIFIFSPDSLELALRFKSTFPSEIKDFHFAPHNAGRTLTYVTASFIETISSNSGTLLRSSSTADKKTTKTLGKYFFSKVRYVGEHRVIITAAFRNGTGAAVLEYNTETRKVTREKVISSRIKGIVAIDVSAVSGVFAVAGNDFSVSLLRISDFKIVKTYTKLHKFAVTCLSFSPDGKKLATGSASNTMSVLLVKSSSGGFFSFVYSLFRFIFFAVLVAVFASFIQRAHENGELAQFIDLSKTYGSKALVHAQHYQKVGLELLQKYGKEYFELSQHYGKVGYDIAKVKTFKGLELVKEQINKPMAPSNKEEPAIAEPLDVPDWAHEKTTERTYTMHSDIVQPHTQDVHELTKIPGEKVKDPILEFGKVSAHADEHLHVDSQSLIIDEPKVVDEKIECVAPEPLSVVPDVSQTQSSAADTPTHSSLLDVPPPVEQNIEEKIKERMERLEAEKAQSGISETLSGIHETMAPSMSAESTGSAIQNQSDSAYEQSADSLNSGQHQLSKTISNTVSEPISALTQSVANEVPSAASQVIGDAVSAISEVSDIPSNDSSDLPVHSVQEIAHNAEQILADTAAQVRLAVEVGEPLSVKEPALTPSSFEIPVSMSAGNVQAEVQENPAGQPETSKISQEPQPAPDSASEPRAASNNVELSQSAAAVIQESAGSISEVPAAQVGETLAADVAEPSQPSSNVDASVESAIQVREAPVVPRSEEVPTAQFAESLAAAVSEPALLSKEKTDEEISKPEPVPTESNSAEHDKESDILAGDPSSINLASPSESVNERAGVHTNSPDQAKAVHDEL